MKKCYTIFLSFIRRVFLFIKLHIHVEAGIRKADESREESDAEESSQKGTDL